MNDEYQKYLKEIAKKNTTEAEKVDGFVEEATGRRPVSKSRILAGEANEVYEASLGYKNVIVRIRRNINEGFGQEKWAIDQCTLVGVPVPKILLIKHEQEEDKVLSVCVQERLRGEPMERGKIDYWDMPDDQVRKLFRESGLLLAKIHSIPVTGFDNLDANGQGKFSTFEGMMNKTPEQRVKFLAMARQLEIPEAKIDKALEIIAGESRRFSIISPVLNHGDFGAKHIMYQDWSVTGIIDFGDVLGHSPVHDFARWEYWFGNNKYFDWLKEGYTNKALFGPEFEELSHLIQLNNCLNTINWYHKEKYTKGIKHGVDKLTELLRNY